MQKKSIETSEPRSWTTSVAVAILFLLGLTASSLEGSSRRRALRPGVPSAPPLVLFDQGHFSAHRIDTTYARFAAIVRDEGWALENYSARFDLQALRPAKILVIVNALNERNAGFENWTLPTPSAFTADEIAAVRDWVEEGGGLLLIADHMPFPGAAADLAAAFGVEYNNGFAFDPQQLVQPRTCLAPTEVHLFQRSNGTLADHPLTAGIDQIATFTGSAFRGDITPLMIFNATSVSLVPQTAWVFPTSTPRISVAGWSQGAVKQFGRGRVAMFGEAAMFSEQTCGPGFPMGMNSPLAAQNRELLINVLRWLAGRRD